MARRKKVDSSLNGVEVAIIAVTRRGVALGRCLSQLFPGSHLYLPERFAAGQMLNEHIFLPPARKVVQKAFAQYRYLVLIMAVGAAVRLLASELKGKGKDPGVVVVDDGGTFAVSLLSGHVGGANKLTKRVASFLGAQPVITTASDASGTIAVDLLGKEFGWEIEDSHNIPRVAASLVNGECVGIYQDAGETDWWQGNSPLPENIRVFTSIEALMESGCQAALIITDCILGEGCQSLRGGIITYRPKSLVVGIGCNRNTEAVAIEEAVKRVFTEHGLSIKSIRKIATIDLRKNEAGLLEFAQKYRLPVDYFDTEALSRVEFPSEPSATALKHVGTPAVCESAAILSSGNPSLVVPKISFGQAVSVAVARLRFDSQKPARRGRLFLVGLGPGTLEHMTFRAREALKASDIVVGYKNYIRLAEPFIAGKEVRTTGMTEEIQRAEVAIESAQQGKTVSVICSGDSGMYGMAGLVGELLHECGTTVDVEVVPGVPAMVASAALLGAPVTTDFVSISLSDYLVPWSKISQRLEVAAQADFVIVLYNPKSKKRQHQLAEAREIILRYRSPRTPVGIVANAGREGQRAVIADLQHLLNHEIDMNTTVIIGNSTTFTFGDWMVTPRGYLNKYHANKEASR
jgi:cobalt-precorrin 5A hydrolase/precorrin-3B C17-methyltransferase